MTGVYTLNGSSLSFFPGGVRGHIKSGMMAWMMIVVCSAV